MDQKVTINSKNDSYHIHFTDSIKRTLFKLLNKFGELNRIFVVVDSNVYKHHSEKIRRTFRSQKPDPKYFLFKPGENSKSLESIQKIYHKLAENNFGKDTLLIAIGGGITGDISGFTASTYMRGIPLIHIPTTITSVVDSAIGGKTGVNFFDVKNLVGSVYHPQAVLIDTDFLKTLPEAEIRSGLGEVVKYGYLSNIQFYNYLVDNLQKLFQLSRTELNYVVKECILLKSSVVEVDETETSLRKILNFGHTFGHAIESVSDFKISHGEAVVAGIVSALLLSFQLEFIDSTKLNIFLKLPLKFGLSKKVLKVNENRIFEIMKLDKKNRKDKIRFVLIKNAGELLIDINTSKSNIVKAIKDMKKLVLV